MKTHCDIVRQFIEHVINRGEVDAVDQFFWENYGLSRFPFPARVQELKV